MNTETVNLSSHLGLAQSLYEQRVNNTNLDYTVASIQVAIERRLLVHLHVLSKEIDQEEAVPNDDAALFIYIARRLLSSENSNIEHVISFSKEFFIEYLNPDGLIDAFILFFNDDINNLLSELFESNKSLRATIISIWHVCGQKIPLGTLNQSELQHFDNDLQSAVLTYQTGQENVGLDLFKKYYRSLIDNVKKENLSSSVVLASLWGGMLRRDENVNTAIRRAIELEKDESNREKYLRLAAIGGENELLPIFVSVAENKPEFGSYLISLLGGQESIKTLYSMLQDPKISKLIIPAWKLLTGQELNVVPRMSLVSDKTSANVTKDEQPMIADVDAAKQWIKKNTSQWEKNTRYIHGEICNKTNLIKLCYLLSGKVAKDIFELLALNSDEKINLTLNNWISERYLQLDELS